MRSLKSASVVGFTFLALVSGPATAQTSDTTSSKDTSQTNITIFAKRRPDSIRGFSQISAQSSGSCSYMVANAAAEQITDDYLSGAGYDTGTLSNAPAALVPLHGEGTDFTNSSAFTNPQTGTELTDTSLLRPRVNDRAVFGDASQTTGDQGYFNATDMERSPNMTGGGSGFNIIASSPGGCTTADATESAGRNFIARKDTTFRDAMTAYEAKDYAKALNLFERNYTKLRYPESALMIAQIYLNGEGVPADPGKAIVWLKKVAEMPSPDFDGRQRFDPADPYAMIARNQGIMVLARLYMTGNGVAKDPKEARKWFIRADQGEYIPATHDVGLIFESGYGGEKDVHRAVAYFQRAGEAGFAPSEYHLGQLYYSGAEGVTEDKAKAGAWLLLAAKAGHPDALYTVGRMYELGEGGAKPDLNRALFYYKEAAIRGQVDAQVTLATYLYSGKDGAPKNLDIARKLFEAAAGRGDPDAMFNLAVMMVNGEGGPKDLVRAYCWLSLADKAGLAKAKAAVQEVAMKMTPDEHAQAEALLNPKAKS
ncbi:MAG TPA: SEL1-like repeat protein [Asticcacaulis sp.]|nr:SEL1-like repeat protein [Asticcacaulis sp.]